MSKSKQQITSSTSSFSLENDVAFEILQAETSLVDEKWNEILKSLAAQQLVWESDEVWNAPMWRCQKYLKEANLVGRDYLDLWLAKAVLMREILSSLNAFVKYRKTDTYRKQKYSAEKITQAQELAEKEFDELESDLSRCGTDCTLSKFSLTKNYSEMVDGNEWKRESKYVLRSKEGVKRVYYPKLRAWRISNHKWYAKNYFWTCCGAPTQHHPPVHIDI